MKRTWDRIHVWLAGHAPRVLASLRPGATDEAIRAAEAELSASLPDDVRACYRIHDGQAASERLLGWAPSFLYGQEWYALERVLDSWRVLKRLAGAGIFTRRRSQPDGPIRKEWWHPAWIPLTSDHTACHYCLDLAPLARGNVGQIILWQNDDPGRLLEATSFRAWLDDFADELEDGVWRTHPDYDGILPFDHVSDDE